MLDYLNLAYNMMISSFFYYVNLSILSKSIYNNIGKGGEALN